MVYRNHEGYHDPTAGIALERTFRLGKVRYRVFGMGLVFRLGELDSFRTWVELYSSIG